MASDPWDVAALIGWPLPIAGAHPSTEGVARYWPQASGPTSGGATTKRGSYPRPT